MVVALLLGVVGSANASLREAELFERSYGHYLSYQPEKALEGFELFLREFPRSSARDAVLFWKAKSLMQLQRREEAGAAFLEILSVFPESPYRRFSEKALEEITGMGVPSAVPKGGLSSAFAPAETRGEEELKKRMDLTEKGLAKALEDRDQLETLLRKAKAENEELSRKAAMVEELESANRRLLDERALLETGLKETEAKVARMSQERERISAETDAARKRIEALSAQSAAGNSARDEIVLLKEEKESLTLEIETRNRKIAETEQRLSSLAESMRMAGKNQDEKLADANKRVAELSREKTALEESLREIRAHLDDRKGRDEELERRTAALRERLREAEEKEKAAREREKRLAQLAREEGETKERIAKLTEEKKALAAALKERDDRAAETERSLGTLTARLRALEEAKAEKERDDAAAVALSREKKALEDELERRKKDSEELRTKQVEIETTVAALERSRQEEFESWAKEKERLEAGMRLLQKEKEDRGVIAGDVTKKEALIGTLEAQLRTQEERIKALQESLARSGEETKGYVGKLKEYEVSLAGLRLKNEDLGRQVAEREEALRSKTVAQSTAEGLGREVAALRERLREAEEKEKAARERENRLAQLEREEGETKERIAKLTEEKKALAAALKERDDRAAEEIRKAKAEGESLSARLRETEKSTAEEQGQLRLRIETLEKEKREMEVGLVALRSRLAEYDRPVLSLGGSSYSLRQILEDRTTASSVAVKIGKGDALWRQESPYDDFVIEQALYARARKAGIEHDKAALEALSRTHGIDGREREYLARYLAMERLVRHRLVEGIDEKELKNYYEANRKRYLLRPGERTYDALSIPFTSRDEFEKSLIALEFFQEARGGRTLEQIYRSRPDILRFKRLAAGDLPEWVRERVAGLSQDEVSNVISTAMEMLIVRPRVVEPAYRPFPEVREEILKLLSSDRRQQSRILGVWLEEIKKEALIQR